MAVEIQTSCTAANETESGCDRQERDSLPSALTVAHHLRPVVANGYSLEKVFEAVRANLPQNVSARVVRPSHANRGVVPRLRNALEAGRELADVHHVLGDTHYVALALPRERTVVTVADTVFQLSASPLKREILRWLWYRWPLSRAARVVAISDATRAALHDLGIIDKKRVRVIPCCTSRAFRAIPERPLDPKRPRFLLVGTGQHKNLVRTFAALEGLSCEVAIVGRLSLEQRAAAERCNLEVREYFGVSEAELVGLYGSCDVVLFASTFEGFGLPILEANTVERPIVAGNVWSLPEVAGRAAVLVDPFDVSAIRRGIDAVLESADLRRALVEAGRTNRLRFAPEAVASEYAELYGAVRG